MSRRPLIAVLVLSVVSALSAAGTAHAAVGDLPRLTEGPPAGIDASWYDDHSVIGDNHLSWSPEGGSPIYANTDGQASQSEPKAIGFDPALTVSGPGGFEVCGYPSGTVGWMRAYQAAPGVLTAGGSCPASEPAIGQFGWFRYVYGRHSPTDAFNRWHIMDLERFALVPLPASAGGPPDGTPTVWDNHWGTCLGLGTAAAQVSCPTDRSAGRLDVGVATGSAQSTGIYYTTTTRTPGIIDQQVIPIPVNMQPRNGGRLANGLYQVVDLANPYGLIKEADGAIGSVSCTTVNFSIGTSGTDFGLIHVPVVDAAPATCYLPSSLDPMLTGPGGFDPMAGADAIVDCAFTGSHCWPGDTAPHDGPFTAAHSLATGNPAYIASTAIQNGSAIPEAISATGRRAFAARPTPPPSNGLPPGTTPPAAPKTLTPAQRRAATVAKTRTRTALRRVFGTGLSRLSVSCRLRPASAASCTVSWRKSSARYSGHVYLRNHRVNGRLRWQYRVDITKKKGKTTTHVRRGYRTGGTVS
jgi:hypothetical protein